MKNAFGLNSRFVGLHCFVLVVWSVMSPSLVAIPIDNGVEGDPEIECGAAGININFNTKNNFEGHVYVKGRYAEAGCRNDDGGRRVAGINIPFAACGTERVRSLNPKGIYVKQYVIITFHPQFLTKVDRAYAIQCFYMEADKTVSQDLEVSEITTLFQSQVAQMPTCRYEILDGGPTGQPVKFAIIGQQVYHKWTCDTDTTDMFCMLVHSCQVDDGSGNKATLLDDTGCGLDKHLLQHLEYATDLAAGRESHVFKYADKAGLFFSCQLTVSIKEPGAQCPRPQCPDLGGGASAPSAGAPAPQPAANPPPPPAAGAAAQATSVPPPPSRPSKKPVVAAIAGGTLKPAAPAPPPPPPPQPAPPPPAPAAPPPLAGQKLRDVKLVPRRRFYRQAGNETIGNLLIPQENERDIVGVIDVQAQSITALDIDLAQSDFDKLPSNRRFYNNRQIDDDAAGVSSTSSSIYCMPPVYLSLLLALAVTSSLATVMLVVRLLYRRRRRGQMRSHKL